MSITQTLIEERLSLTLSSHNHVPNKIKKTPIPLLMRSSSFNRLKQFPSCLHAYLCRSGSVSILQWLTSSQTKLSQLLPQLHNFLFIFTLHCVVSLICIQFVISLITLLISTPPSGLIFLMTCIFIMSALAIRLNFPQRLSRRSRTRSRTNKD